MITYAERTIFSAKACALYADAVDVLKRVGDHWANELRCHELVRATRGVLELLGHENIVHVDGKLGMIEHSWLIGYTHSVFSGMLVKSDYILDVYCPGRIPSVQLIHCSHAITNNYIEGERRVDIKHDIIAKLKKEMKPT